MGILLFENIVSTIGNMLGVFLLLLNVALSKHTTDEGLRECFAKFSEVVHGWSKGFGFVRYSTLEGAAAGIEGMDEKVTTYTPLSA
ncbi:putative RNA recognition motif domain, nucleotide-binding alpha-beta plait domain superfamily [Helianthus anomalus]